MDHHRHTTLLSATMLAAALWLLSDSNETSTVAPAAGDPWGRYRTTSPSSVLSGAEINVALGRDISSETATVGDVWYGTVTEYVMTLSEGVIPPGSEVTGVVSGVAVAAPGSPAMIELGIRSIRVNGHDESIVASADPVIAGSTRAHQLNAIAGEAAAGQLAGSNGCRFVLSDGTVMSFTASQTVAMR